MPVFRKKDVRQYWDQPESEFDAAATVAVWLTLSIMALIFGVLAWLVQDFVWPHLRHFLG